MSKLKIGCLIVLAIPVLWTGAYWLGGALPETVAESERYYEYGRNRSFGYWVGKYRWRDGFSISVWAGTNLSMRFEVPGIELVRIKTQRWLAEDRAILLEIQTIYHDSIDSRGEVALIYDYERGELHSLSLGGWAWLVSPAEENLDRQLSKTEFDELIKKLSAPVKKRPPKPAALPPWDAVK